MFNPKDVAENLKKSGAFIPGIRPGEQSARYIDGVLTRLTLFGRNAWHLKPIPGNSGRARFPSKECWCPQ
jgi:hypothetical protein